MKKGNKIENGELVIIVLVSLFVFFTILQNVVVRQQDTAVRTDNDLEPESSGLY